MVIVLICPYFIYIYRCIYIFISIYNKKFSLFTLHFVQKSFCPSLCILLRDSMKRKGQHEIGVRDTMG